MTHPAAFAMDLLDLAAQATMIAGIAHGSFGVGLAGAAALLAASDKVSLATAALSCLAGVSGEVLAAAQAEARGEKAGGSAAGRQSDAGQQEGGAGAE
jgi:hypothetical protein